MDVDLSAYYTSGQIDALLQNKSALGHTHNMSELTNDAGFATTEWVEQQDYATNTALTAGLAKKLDADWFASLFTVYDTDGLKVSPNDYSKTADSIRAMFGFWTDKYLSALGKTDNVAYHEVYLTDEDGNYLLDSDGNYITTTRLLAALEGGVSEDALWSLLAPDGAGEVYATAQIGLEHLTDALKEYAGTLGLGQYALKTDVTEAVGAVQKTLGVHTQRTDNPHSVTKAQVGLGNVENTALSTWTGTNKITTLGTITSGTWRGSKIANAYLENSSLTIAGLAVSLGGSIAAADLAKKFYWANVQLSATSSTETTPTFKSVTIGSVTLSCDSDGCLHINKGVYSDSFVSAMGKNAGTASTGISEADMWEALGTDSSTQVIPAEHLDLSGVSGGSTDLSGYYTSAQTDALLQNKSALGHTHTKSEITDFPASLKNPSSLTLQLNGTTKATYDGSSPATVNVTPSAIGAAASSHQDHPSIELHPGANVGHGGFIDFHYNNSSADYTSRIWESVNGKLAFITPNGVEFSSTIYGTDFTGNAATATKLQTARTLTIGNTGKSFNGSANVSWTLSEIGAAAVDHVNHTNIEFFPGTASGHGGYIDFHFNNSSADYTSRIIEYQSGKLQFEASNGFVFNAAITASNFIATSDMRLKDVTGEDAVLDAEVIADAPLFRFRWKEREDGTEYIGTSAQYWQERCPQVVCDADGRLGVDYGALGVAAGVSLAREVVELRARVKTLEDRLARMEAMMSKLMGGQAE